MFVYNNRMIRVHVLKNRGICVFERTSWRTNDEFTFVVESDLQDTGSF